MNTINGILGSLMAASAIAFGAVPDAMAKGNDKAFTNPVIWADAPDPDVIRVGDDYYMVTTTMHLMPGCPVMHSPDLVNWETIGYVFDRLEDTPRYDLLDGTVYGRGQWATSLRYRDGWFYVLFSPNDEPYRSYIYRTQNPAVKWELVCRAPHFHDASLLLDDDGKAYVFYNGGEIRLRQLNDDLNGVKEGGIDTVVIRPDGTETGLHEGSRVIKHNGKYYAFVISWPAGKPRRQLCYVADKITGPYEKHVVLESEFGGFSYVGQGCLVDDSDGNWWGMIFQDRGGVGRVLTLNPCTWVDDVPMLGDKEGKVPAVWSKKLRPSKKACVASSDEFSKGKKSILWEWNHNPIDSAWSLTDRKGYLRLKTQRVVDNLFLAPNTISQRMCGPVEEAAVRIETNRMLAGDRAGFAALNGDTGFIGVEKRNDGKYIVMGTTSVQMADGKNVTGTVDNNRVCIPFEGNEVYLKIRADFNPGQDWAWFSYSTDGKEWHDAGEPFKMIFDYRRFFMGTRYAIYNYATETPGGYVDVDWFRINTVD